MTDPDICDLCGKRAEIYGMRHKECVADMEKKKGAMSMIDYANGTLWGAAGGQLEYVGQRVGWDKTLERPVIIIRFTDHDHAMNDPEDAPELIEGRYYDLTFPVEPCDDVQPKPATNPVGDFWEGEADRLNREMCEKDLEISKLKSELAKAVKFLKEGKAQFAPHTTNSFVDDFIAKHKEPADGAT